MHVVGGPRQFGIVLYQHAVLQDGDARSPQELAVGGEARPVPNDVVRLPLARTPAGIHQRRRLRIDSAGLAVGVGLVVERIEDLQLVFAHEVDAAVAPALVLVMRRIGLSPLDMQMAVALSLRGVNVARALTDYDRVGNMLPLVPAAPI